MFSKKPKVALILIVLFALWICDGFAEESSAKTVVALGSIKLTVPSASVTQVANNSSINASVINNTSINTSAINSTMINSSIANSSAIANLSSENKLTDKPEHVVPVLDLSRYAKDRLNRNLGGYRNVIYPMAESSGFTANTGGTGGGSGGGGCGCGG